ncbi:MAG: hypothetical protein EBZ50_11895 [Alphaproteobacteria bacterium]|nr:hypothetical protein [Alphaproteobacteria bacterium]
MTYKLRVGMAIRLLTGLALVATTAACASAPRPAKRWYATVEPLDRGVTDDRVSDFRNDVVGILGGAPTGAATYEDYVKATRWAYAAEGDRRARLIDLRDVLIARSDRACEAYIGGIGAARRTSRLSLTVSSTILAAAGGIAAPERSAKLLSTLAAVASGARGNTEEELFANQAMPVMVSALDAHRTAKRNELHTSYALAPDAKDLPSPVSIISAVAAYNEECSLNRALASAQRASAQSAPAK